MKIFNDERQLTHEAQSLVNRCRDAMERVVQGRRWIAATPVLVGAENMASSLIKLGAEEVLAVGVTEGVRSAGSSEVEPPKNLQTHCLELSFDGDMMDGIRGAERALSQLDRESLTRVKEFDPLGNARVMRSIFCTDYAFAGRPVFGARDAKWQALEDKTIIDAFWDDAGVRRVSSINAPLNFDAIHHAYTELNRGSGVVIAGDSEAGFHGGAARTRWANTSDQLLEIIADLSQECSAARVMPYLDGVSCSMHGWVFPNGEVISLKPCEMLISRSQRDTHFDYHGAAIHWRPSEEIHQQMSDAVIRAGELLTSRYQYRGVFTIDGIATAEGFYPTELNPRFGGALGRMSAALPDLPILVMHCATIEGYSLGVTPSELRELIISAADERSVVRGMIELDEPCTQPQSAYFKQTRDHAWVRCGEHEDYHARVNWGVALKGSLVFVNLKPEIFERGEETGPTLCSLLMAAKAEFTRGDG